MEGIKQDKSFPLRINHYLLDMAKEVAAEKSDKYNNVSHFIRCAIIKLVREEKGE